MIGRDGNARVEARIRRSIMSDEVNLCFFPRSSLQRREEKFINLPCYHRTCDPNTLTARPTIRFKYDITYTPIRR
jgi:hypothetical protein